MKAHQPLSNRKMTMQPQANQCLLQFAKLLLTTALVIAKTLSFFCLVFTSVRTALAPAFIPSTSRKPEHRQSKVNFQQVTSIQFQRRISSFKTHSWTTSKGMVKPCTSAANFSCSSSAQKHFCSQEKRVNLSPCTKHGSTFCSTAISLRLYSI